MAVNWGFAKAKAKNVEISHMSGLSGLSDIIGEVLAEGGVDLEEAGISPREAERLAKKARGKIEKDKLRHSVEKLKNIVEQTEVNWDKHDPEWHDMIKGYMAEKRSERREAYKKHRADLRELEVNPYKPNKDALQDIVGSEAFLETLKERDEMRHLKERKNMKRRMLEAELLVGSMIVEKPDLPPSTSSPRKPSPTKLTPKLTHKATFSKMSPVLSRRSTSDVAHKILKPTIARKGPTVSMREQREILDRTRNLGDDVQVERRGILKISVSPTRDLELKYYLDNTEPDATMGSSTELLDYARAMDEMEEEQVARPESEEQSNTKPYKEKSFKELVRLQRPEITRKVAGPKPDHIAVPGLTAIEQNISESRRTTARDSTLEIKRRLYGTKHIPNSSKVINISPRRVKTYTERLQEMKSHQTYSTPVVPRHRIPASARTPSVRSMSRRRPTGPTHKPQTYVEQLQKLNPHAVRKMKGGKTITVQPRTFMKTRKPLHEPKTYTEQLQAMQPPKELYRTARSDDQKTLQPHGRGMTRPRPYGDPYRSMHEDITQGWEVKSEVSDWTIDDDVKQLLYGEDTSSKFYPVGSVDYQMSEGVSDYFEYVMGDDYTASVDIDEIAHIADAASIDSGSVLSVIDWDAVEEIIAHED